MLILGINTATNQNAITIFNNNGVLAEKVWSAEQNEAETLLPFIKEILQISNKEFAELEALLVVAGPGPFTSLRVGVITANALAYGLGIHQYTVSTFDYYKKRLPEDLANKNPKLFVSAGKNLGYFKDQKTPQTIEEINAEISTNQNTKNPLLYGNFLPQQIEDLSSEIIEESNLKTFGQAFFSIDFSKLKKQDQIEPLYIQPAKITMSKKITG